eukprot:CAMPEP_0172835220 /NCGR_PEP_ID=MMETSP1075-20121228/25595_1 /TAXON_ID=2916 /ORGANISM="Ceratium fusus, Strain PA161109" /LENGTH=360 /DNA_ID=CAMNT_0013678231 /DNA_START=14 /DNA_END=1096 /DNA_ORIENTATION=+
MASEMETPRAKRGIRKSTASSQFLPAEQAEEVSDSLMPMVASVAAGGGSTRAASVAAGPKGEHTMTRLQHEAAKRKKEQAARQQALETARENDEKQWRERKARSLQAREAKFESMFEEICRNAPLRIEASETIRQYEEEQARRRRQLHEHHDREVAQRVEHRLAKWKNKAPPPAPESYREQLLTSDNPCTAELRAQRGEEKFDRAATLFLETSPSDNIKDTYRYRHMAKHNRAGQSLGRPALPVHHWGQKEQQASPRSFDHNCARGDGFRTARRLGYDSHRIDESDSVVAVGKMKTRFERNSLGMLEGTLAREGEAVRHKAWHGASSGAPCQDHFGFETGHAVTAREFPVGKRLFPEYNS